MLWELEPRVLDKCAMPLQAYRLRPTGLGIQTKKPRPQAALTPSRHPLTLTPQVAHDPPLPKHQAALTLPPAAHDPPPRQPLIMMRVDRQVRAHVFLLRVW